MEMPRDAIAWPRRSQVMPQGPAHEPALGEVVAPLLPAEVCAPRDPHSATAADVPGCARSHTQLRAGMPWGPSTLTPGIPSALAGRRPTTHGRGCRTPGPPPSRRARACPARGRRVPGGAGARTSGTRPRGLRSSQIRGSAARPPPAPSRRDRRTRVSPGSLRQPLSP
jgi:hypothetical protein